MLATTKQNQANEILSKEMRDSLISRTEVLNKVKQLLLVPKLEIMTIKQVSEYFEVDFEVIKRAYQRNKNEIDSDGTSVKQLGEFLKEQNVPLENGVGKSVLTFDNGMILEVPNRGIRCFSSRAILRIAMLLRDSEVAKEVRTQLLNVVEHSTEEQKLLEINNELKLGTAIGEAYAAGDMNKLLQACMSYNNYLTRHIDALKIENEMLAKGLAKWGFSKTLNALIRAYGYSVFNGNYSLAWNTYYKELYSRLGISLKKRDGDRTLVSRIKPEEETEAIKIAAAMCERKNLDIARIINDVNAQILEGGIDGSSSTRV